MAQSHIFLGIDNDAITAALIKKQGKSGQLLEQKKRSLGTPFSVDSIHSDVFKKELQALLKECEGWKGNDIVFAIPPTCQFLYSFTFEKLHNRDVDEHILSRLSSVVPLKKEDIDFTIISRGKNTHERQYTVIATSASAARTIQSIAKEAGFTCDIMAYPAIMAELLLPIQDACVATITPYETLIISNKGVPIAHYTISLEDNAKQIIDILTRFQEQQQLLIHSIFAQNGILKKKDIVEHLGNEIKVLPLEKEVIGSDDYIVTVANGFFFDKKEGSKKIPDFERKHTKHTPDVQETPNGGESRKTKMEIFALMSIILFGAVLILFLRRSTTSTVSGPPQGILNAIPAVSSSIPEKNDIILPEINITTSTTGTTAFAPNDTATSSTSTIIILDPST